MGEIRYTYEIFYKLKIHIRIYPIEVYNLQLKYVSRQFPKIDFNVVLLTFNNLHRCKIGVK
jgi:hypothetical protein